MGTRGQVFVKDTGVYLYQNSDAYDLPNVVRNALKRGKDSWNDEEYLTRIIFNQMTAMSELELTGYGIGTEIHGDIEYLITIDVSEQRVSVMHRTWDGELLQEWKYTFTQFVKSKTTQWSKEDFY